MTEAQVLQWLAQWRSVAPAFVIGAPLIVACVVAAMGASRWAGGVAALGMVLTCAAAIDLGYASMTFRTPMEPVGGFMMIVQAGAALVVFLGAGGTVSQPKTRDASLPLAMVLVAIGFALVMTIRAPESVALGAPMLGLVLAALTAAGAASHRATVQAALMAVCAFGVGAALLTAGLGLSGEGLARAFALALAMAGVLIVCGVFPFDGPVHQLQRLAPAGASFLIAPCVALPALYALSTLIEPRSAGDLANTAALALAVMGAGATVVSAVQAALARDVRRMIASTIGSQLACVLIGFAAQTSAGGAAGLVHAVTCALLAFGLIGAAAVVAPHAGVVMVFERLDGLGKRRPLAAAAFAVSVLSAAGAPLTIGFLSKWQLIQAALGQGWWWAAAAIVAASLVMVPLAGRVIERLYFTPDTEAEAPALSGVALTPVLIGVTLATLALGVSAADLALWAVHVASAGGGR